MIFLRSDFYTKTIIFLIILLKMFVYLFLVFQKKLKKLINILKIKKSYFNKYFENIDQIITDGLSSLKLYVLSSIKLIFILVWSIVIIRSFCV